MTAPTFGVTLPARFSSADATRRCLILVSAPN
jgi:hypothetical protein